MKSFYDLHSAECQWVHYIFQGAVLVTSLTLYKL